jgi:REP element-mobilizing transposase RayT
MARKPRIVFAGAIYHVTFRGNERRNIFRDDDDRERFLLSLAERTKTYQIRLYLYALMPNHVHLLIETRMPNVSAFLGSLLTSYATYFNRRHQRAGHLTQNRYHSCLVEGDVYLLRLSRYIHLNPVFAKPWATKALNIRIKHLREYHWSSYRGYVGISPREDFVDYEPVLAMISGRRGDRQTRYREYVETGMAVTDDEFRTLINESSVGIGSEEFVKEAQRRYRQGATRIKAEDAAFRKPIGVVSPDAIVQAVCRAYGISAAELSKHRINDWIKPVAAALLTQIGGLSQREAAIYLGIKTGAAVCLQLKRLRDNPPPEHQIVFEQLLREFNI